MGKRGRPPHPDILTPREWQVLDLIRQDLTNEQIAHRLDISPATAKYHVSEILSKLNVTTREQAAAWQPEAAPVAKPRGRWWAPLIAWLRPLTIAKALGIAASVAALAGLGVLAWGVLRADGSGTDDRSAANVSTPSATSIPGDTTFQLLTITDAENTKLLFTRGQVAYYEPGALWMSNLDGSDSEALIDESAVSDVLRVVRHWQTGNPTVFYTVRDPLERFPAIPRGRQTVATLDLATGDRAELLAFDIEGNQVEGAAVTNDGRSIAYTDVQGLAILDTSTGQTRRVLDSDTEPCKSAPRGETLLGCGTFLRPSWSPDGSLLAMTQIISESGGVVVVDVNAEPPGVTAVEYDGL